jgi:hypothetical protein
VSGEGGFPGRNWPQPIEKALSAEEKSILLSLRQAFDFVAPGLEIVAAGLEIVAADFAFVARAGLIGARGRVG